MNKKNKMKSLKYYINNKEELINQVFLSISEKQIKKLIPTSLKGMSIDELKAECLVQLLTMSNSQIKSILEGIKCIEDSKSVDTKDDKKISKKRVTRSMTNLIENKKRKFEDLESTTSDQQNESSFSKGPRWRKKHREKKNKIEKKKKNSDEDEKNDPYSKEKNLLELLELEMRAKAIRSLLKQEEEEEEIDKQSDKNENIKMETEFNKKEKNEGLRILRSGVKYKNEITIDENERKSRLQNVTPESKKMEINVQSSLELKITSQNTLDNAETVEEKYDWNEEEKLLYEDYDSDEKTEKTYKEKEKNEDNSTNSWAERWLQSKDVKRVVATSKMLAAVRNKMKNNLKTLNTTKQNLNDHKIEAPEMVGTVKEYDTLEQMKTAVIEDATRKNLH